MGHFFLEGLVDYDMVTHPDVVYVSIFLHERVLLVKLSFTIRCNRRIAEKPRSIWQLDLLNSLLLLLLPL